MLNPKRKERRRPTLSPTNRSGVTVPPSALESIANPSQYLVAAQELSVEASPQKRIAPNGIRVPNFHRIINKSKLLALIGRKIIFYGVGHAFTPGQRAHKTILAPYGIFDHFDRVSRGSQIVGILA